MPFGEELCSGVGGRTTGMGFCVNDGIRQQFTSKERDVETGLDYFGARYFASVQGRFSSADPYNINLERQETADGQEADALFRNYIRQPQHWNRYTYALDNPLGYVDPNGLKEYHTTVLGQRITVHIDDSIINDDPDAYERIKNNLQKAFDKINSGENKMLPGQVESMHSQNRISVSNENMIGTYGDTYHMTQRMAENPSIETLAAEIIHDSRHSEQIARGLNNSEANAVTMEQEASQFTVEVMNRTGGWNPHLVKAYEDDARTGHLRREMNDKTTPESRAKVLKVMSRPQKPRN
jgi:RHS repeat-associated protein